MSQRGSRNALRFAGAKWGKNISVKKKSTSKSKPEKEKKTKKKKVKQKKSKVLRSTNTLGDFLSPQQINKLKNL